MNFLVRLFGIHLLTLLAERLAKQIREYRAKQQRNREIEQLRRNLLDAKTLEEKDRAAQNIINRFNRD